MGEKAREAASDLVVVLKGGNAHARWAAAEALGLIGARTPEVLSALEAAKGDSSVAASKSAERSLAALRSLKGTTEP